MFCNLIKNNKWHLLQSVAELRKVLVQIPTVCSSSGSLVSGFICVSCSFYLLFMCRLHVNPKLVLLLHESAHLKENNMVELCSMLAFKAGGGNSNWGVSVPESLTRAAWKINAVQTCLQNNSLRDEETIWGGAENHSPVYIYTPTPCFFHGQAQPSLQLSVCVSMRECS